MGRVRIVAARPAQRGDDLFVGEGAIAGPGGKVSGRVQDLLAGGGGKHPPTKGVDLSPIEPYIWNVLVPEDLGTVARASTQDTRATPGQPTVIWVASRPMFVPPAVLE